MKPHIAKKLFLIPAFLLLASCSPLVKSEQLQRSDIIPLQSGGSVGQTFASRFDGLEGVAIYLRPGNPGSGNLSLHLRSASPDGEEIASARLPLEKVTEPGFYRLQFPALQSSTSRDYYLEMKIEGQGSVSVGSSPGDAYINGASYTNGTPNDAQLAFRLLYDPDRLALGLLREVFIWLVWLAAGFFLFVIPGWAALRLLLPGWYSLSWGEKLALSAGLSLAIYPLLFLWTSLVGLQLGRLYAWIPAVIGAAIIIISWLMKRRVVEKSRIQAASLHRLSIVFPSRGTIQMSSPVLSATLPGLLLLLITILIFASRFWAIRGLEAPLWGDSVQHTVMAQLMLDNGGLFRSWLPYAPYNSLTVQFGFPVEIAVFSWLTGTGSLQGTLVVGQLLNGFAVIGLYPLALRLSGGNRWAGLGAVLIAGLLSPMPAFYFNWGRYAQLTGQAILPASLWLLLAVYDHHTQDESESRPRFSWQTAVLAGLALGGMLLAYYRMAFYWATFVAAWLIAWGLPVLKFNLRSWSGLLKRIILIGLIGILLFLPWIPRLSGSYLASTIESGVRSGSPLQQALADYRAWREILIYAPLYLLIAALAGFVWSLIKREWMMAALVLWIILLSMYVGGQVVHLPGANMMQSFAVLIALYIPIGLLGGWLFGQVMAYLDSRMKGFTRLSIAAVLIFVSLFGAWNQRSVARPDTFSLLARPDLKAMAWIQANIPSNARFLVEAFPIYGGSTIVGSDGGWWLPLIAHRENMVPPQYAFNEAPIQPGYSQEIVNLVNKLMVISPASPEGIRLLCKQGITHLYIGQRQGRIGAGAKQLFSPQEIEAQSAFHQVYKQDRVAIYALDPQVCTSNP